MKRFLLFISLLFFSSFFPAFAQGIITTVAGGGNGGDGSIATNAHLTAPNDVVVDDSGNLYIALETAIRKVDAQTQIISLYAGSYQPGFGCEGCPATQGKLSHASAIAFDPQGSLHIADWGTSRIRKVDALTGMMTTVAGNGSFGYSGDGGAATQAQLSKPIDIAFDGSGNLYIADERYVIRKVDAQTGVITTIAGNGIQGTWNDGDTAVKTQIGILAGLCVDKYNNVYFSDASAYKIGKINVQGVLVTYCGTGVFGTVGDGGLAVNAETFAGTKINLDKNGNVYFGDPGSIRKIDALSGIIKKIAGNGSSAFSGDGGNVLNAGLRAVSICFDTMGNLFLADKTNLRIRKISGVVGLGPTPGLVEFSLYPDPSSGAFSVQCSKTIKRIEIRNLLGQLVYQSEPQDNRIQINIIAQPDGVYLVSVFAERGVTSKKTIIYH